MAYRFVIPPNILVSMKYSIWIEKLVQNITFTSQESISYKEKFISYATVILHRLQKEEQEQTNKITKGLIFQV